MRLGEIKWWELRCEPVVSKALLGSLFNHFHALGSATRYPVPLAANHTSGASVSWHGPRGLYLNQTLYGYTIGTNTWARSPHYHPRYPSACAITTPLAVSAWRYLLISHPNRELVQGVVMHLLCSLWFFMFPLNTYPAWPIKQLISCPDITCILLFQPTDQSPSNPSPSRAPPDRSCEQPWLDIPNL